MATMRSSFSEINFGFKQLQMSDQQSSPQEGSGSRQKLWTYGVHGPTTQVTGVLQSPGELPTMSLTAHSGDLLPGVHPLITTITLIRVVKLTAQVREAENADLF
jgi:hypothetical protein